MFSKFLYRLKESHLKMSIIFLVTFLFMGLFTDRVHLLVNRSLSLQEHYFFLFPKIKPSKGDITTYEHQSGNRLIKKIIGVEGDMIFYDKDGCVWVSTTKIGKPHRANKQGKILHAISPGVIPKDYVFLYGPHDESFDSRYTEVGLVYTKHLIGKAIGIL